MMADPLRKSYTARESGDITSARVPTFSNQEGRRARSAMVVRKICVVKLMFRSFEEKSNADDVIIGIKHKQDFAASFIRIGKC
jgi:hypothetical protein